MSKKYSIFIILLIALGIFYFQLPVIQYGFTGVTFLLLFIIVIYEYIFGGIRFNLKDIQHKKHLKISDIIKVSKLSKILAIILLLYTFVLPFITSSTLFHWKKYKDLIGKVETGKDLSTQLSPISVEKVRVVDQELANILGDKVIGSQTALGSQVRLGNFNIQKIGNDLYWVAPLLHSGFFKWLNNREGSMGYVTVNACNERDVKLVQNVNGKPIKIKYQFESYFSDYLPRYLYFKGYFNVGLTDYTFEIDDTGKPFWVVTLYKKKVGFRGDDAIGIVIVDAQNGDIQKYNIADAPSWVDRIQPEAFIDKQLNDWGEYVNGIFNFSNQGKLKSTDNPILVYGNDNRSYWYSGLTSVGKDESTVGFMLVDTRTKNAVMYKQGGATAYAAQQSAMGKVQEKGYQASLPIPCNINNIPTYVMTLKDNGGLVKMYAMVSVEDYTTVGVGNTLQETLMTYKSAYNRTGNQLKDNAVSRQKELITAISRINVDVKNGNSFYYFTVKGIKNMFVATSQISSSLPITTTGDSVKISFDNGEQGVIDISKFENLTVAQ